jgi:hypothetical protein
MLLQLWPAIHSVNKADDCRSQSHGRGIYKLGEEVHHEIVVADTASELGAEASDVVEDYFEEVQQQRQASAEVAITNTGQRTRLLCRLPVAKERAQCARRGVGLCVVPCFAGYHTKVNL